MHQLRTRFIDRRRLLRLAVAAGLPVSAGLTGRALAQPRLGTNAMTRDIERVHGQLC
jgi:hypothetical protein